MFVLIIARQNTINDGVSTEAGSVIRTKTVVTPVEYFSPLKVYEWMGVGLMSCVKSSVSWGYSNRLTAQHFLSKAIPRYSPQCTDHMM